jgi:hypothetical protein
MAASIHPTASLRTFFEQDSEVIFLALFVAAGSWLAYRGLRAARRRGDVRRATRRLAVVLAALVVGGVVLLALGGDDDSADQEYARAQSREFAAHRKVERENIKAAIRDRRLPAAALEMFPPDNVSDPDIVPGPDGDGDDEDVITVGGNGGRRGKLRFDFNADGRISADEREITEEEVWNQSYKWRDYSAADRREYVSRRQKIVTAVRQQRLPRVALGMLPPGGPSIKFDFIPRPDGDGNIYTVIRLGGDGTEGRKLRFDLDLDGLISADEREITEKELFEAMYRGGRPRDPDEGDPLAPA